MVCKCLWFNSQCSVDSYSILVSNEVGMNVDSKRIVHIQNHIRNRIVLLVASLVFASWLPNQLRANELKEAKVTQVIQDVKLLQSNASPRAAAAVAAKVKAGAVTAAIMNDQDRASIVITCLLLLPWFGRATVSAMAVWRAHPESQIKGEIADS